MNKIKKGDIVGRLSYGKDIAFVVERIIKTKSGKRFAILKGLTVRVQADSDLDDLELMESEQIAKHVRDLEENVAKRVQKNRKNANKSKKNSKSSPENDSKFLSREKTIIYTGKILHIDGDRKYAEKSNKYYKKIGLNATVKNIPERKQPFVIGNLIRRYKPDIVVITRT